MWYVCDPFLTITEQISRSLSFSIRSVCFFYYYFKYTTYEDDDEQTTEKKGKDRDDIDREIQIAKWGERERYSREWETSNIIKVN